MSESNKQNSYSCARSEPTEVVVVGADTQYPSRPSSDVQWSTSPFFRLSTTANFRGDTSLAYTDCDFEVDENGIVDILENEEKRSLFSRLFSTLRLKLRALGKRIGVVNCVPT